MMKVKTLLIASLVIIQTVALSKTKDISIPMYLAAPDGKGQLIGTVTASQTPYGVLFTPHLHNLPVGVHGFHIHENPNCSNNAEGAGGHLDPNHTGKHRGPYDDSGHLGDLPVLIVNSDGTATVPVLAPRLLLSQIPNHALMIHQGGDNYSDQPAPLGGGGERIACGVIP